MENIKENIAHTFDWKAKFSIVLTVVVLIITSGFIYMGSKLVYDDNFVNTKTLEENFPNYSKLRKDVGQELIESNEKRLKSLLPILIPLYSLIVFAFIYIVTYKLSTKIEEFLFDLNKSLKNSEPIIINEHESNELISDISKNYNKKVSFIKDKQTEFSENIQNIGHELKTPLAALSTEIDVLKYKEDKSEADYKHFVEITDILSRRLGVLVDSLLILEKDKNDIYSDSPQDFSEILENSINDLNSKAERKDVKIYRSIDPDVRVKGQRKYLYALSYNLIDNAIKYSNVGGKIFINLSESNFHPVFEVIDEGIGMNKEETKNVFTRFYRSEKARELGIEGTGLGLAIVKKIVDVYEWKLKIKSKEKFGTNVKVTF